MFDPVPEPRHAGGDESAERTTGVETASARGYGRAAMLAFVVLALLGVGNRVRSYLGDRSMFMDEASLALKVCGQSYGELPRPYGDGGIVAPLGFLASIKACVQSLGLGDRSFRLIPFVAGLAILPLFWALCRETLGRPAAWVGAVLVALSSALIYHGAEIKQYSTDAFFTTALLYAAAAAMNRPGSAGRGAALAALGLVAPWFSHPSIFVLGAIASTFLLGDLARRRLDALAGHAALGGLWAASFLASYRLSSSMVGPGYPFDAYWAFSYLNVPPRSLGDLTNYVATLLGFSEVIQISYTSALDQGVRLGVVFAVAWAAGAYALLAEGRRGIFRVVVLALAFALVARALHKYPLRGRLLVFSIPLNLLVVTAGLDRLMRSTALEARVVGWALFWGCTLLPAMASLREIAQRPTRQEVEPVLREVSRRWQPGDALYVHEEAIALYRLDSLYRGVLDRVPPDSLILGRLPERPLDEASYLDELRPLAGRPRVWVVLTNFVPDGKLSDANLVQIEALDRAGRRLDSITGGKSGWGFLYDLGPMKPHPAGPAASR